MWAFSLSSGTSGGVLAPLLMIGAAIGEGAAHLAHLPGDAQALWALMGMGAMLAGALGVPLTAILFSLELTHALPALLPLVLACTASYLVTSLVMPRSILTEKLGGADITCRGSMVWIRWRLVTVCRSDDRTAAGDEVIVGEQHHLPDDYVFSDETCRAVAEEMATTGSLTLLVVDRDNEPFDWQRGRGGATCWATPRREAGVGTKHCVSSGCQGTDATLRAL